MPQKITLLLLLLFPVYLFGQTPQVPSRTEFAGIKLRITDEARREIQKDVDALTKSPKYFNIKVERAKTYFPFIERVFREEGLHDDFKYLVLQESALIPDAVSSSDAVGFWQFKDFTAMEVGLRVDNHVDERMNIVASSRGAARYMKKNNQYFDNWLHTLQAYQMGPGGALRALGNDQRGVSNMVIDKNTYWYVKKFLAHKIAFENAVDGPGKTQLQEYTNTSNKTLKDISKETGIALQQLEDYNKWLRKSRIPADKDYIVVVPMTQLNSIGGDVKLAAVENKPKENSPFYFATMKIEYTFPDSKFPHYEDYEEAKKGSVVKINRIPAVLGREGDEVDMLARRLGVSLSKFLRYNEIKINDKIIPGQVYYLKKKRRKAMVHFYVAKEGETYWTVAQKFGIRLKILKAKNRVRGDEELKAGRVVWLRYIRPEVIPVEYRKGPSQPIRKEVPSEPVLASTGNTLDAGLIEDQNEKNELNNPGTINVLQDPVVEVTVKDESTLYNEVESSSDEAEMKTGEMIKKIHVVEPGETLYSISKKYNVEVRQIMKWNELAVTDRLKIDQQLIIYKDSTGEVVEYTYHTVSQGDTLYKIARSYDVTIEDLMSWNDKDDFNISMGEKIRIKLQNQ